MMHGSGSPEEAVILAFWGVRMGKSWMTETGGSICLEKEIHIGVSETEGNLEVIGPTS